MHILSTSTSAIGDRKAVVAVSVEMSGLVVIDGSPLALALSLPLGVAVVAVAAAAAVVVIVAVVVVVAVVDGDITPCVIAASVETAGGRVPACAAVVVGVVPNDKGHFIGS